MPGRVFAKCLLNIGLRPDRPAGYVTASQWETGSSGQWRVTSHNGAECTVVCLVATRGLIRCDFSDSRNSVISISLSLFARYTNSNGIEYVKIDMWV